MDNKRLIEHVFPLMEASLDAVHEKSVRHGHLSTLHIWPARRPLAASRAALLATLLDDPRRSEEREVLLRAIGGEIKDGKTEGGVLHWGQEKSHVLEELKQRIRKVYPDTPPVVFDPFAGGGSIPLEAMRLGAKAVAADINPVAWTLLRASIEYPQRLSGKKRPFTQFAKESTDFLQRFIEKTTHLRGGKAKQRVHEIQHSLFPLPDVGLDWHVRAWGHWVLERVRASLANFYPEVDGKTTVAYLWARTAPCHSCGVEIPLLKTRWLVRGDKRVVLTLTPKTDRLGISFGIEDSPAPKTLSASKLREHDKQLGAGTMSRTGVKCPCCGALTPMHELRAYGQTGRLGSVLTAVVYDGIKTKGYRLPTDEERQAAEAAAQEIHRCFVDVPFGIPDEPTPKGGSGASRAFSIDGYGIDTWAKLFNPRQLLALGTFVKQTRLVQQAMREAGYPDDWKEAVSVYLALVLDRLAEGSSTIAHWNVTRDGMVGTFQRYALQISWDYAETNPLSNTTGGYENQLDWVARYIEHGLSAAASSPAPEVLNESAVNEALSEKADIILTDPPYYDAIPYAALMDFFYIWLRRSLHGLSDDYDKAFANPTGPKWDHENQTGELIDDSSRFSGDSKASKKAYEDGMYRSFQACYRQLKDEGRLIIVFAHKKADAWETLVQALIRSGFVVTASWPIQTERGSRTRAQASAALSSSIWLVCRKRPATALPGWDTDVLAAMQEKIQARLKEYWTAGIRGADFVWAATGPAMEAYSAHPFVRKTGGSSVLTVREFLDAVRHMVLAFAVNRVLSELGGAPELPGETTGLDSVTQYYLLHRNDYGTRDVPVGASILYAVACGLDDRELIDTYDILEGGKPIILVEEGEDTGNVEDDGTDGTIVNEPEISYTIKSSSVRIKPWNRRAIREKLGYEGPGGRPVPLIDAVHRLMMLYKRGDLALLREYIRSQGFAHHRAFAPLVQALIQLSEGDERTTLESIQSELLNLERRILPDQQLNAFA